MNPEHVPDVFASECGIYIALHYLLKDRYAYEFSPYSMQQVNYFRRSGVKLSIHYNMIAFIIVWYLHVS